MQLPKFTKEQIQEFAQFAENLSKNLEEGPADHDEHNIALFKEAWGSANDFQMSAFLMWHYGRADMKQKCYEAAFQHSITAADEVQEVA